MTSLQDVARCHLCEAPDPPLHCGVCNMHLCKDCKGKHISDESKSHKLVLFRYRKLLLNVRHIPQKNVNITVKDVTFQSVMIVFPLRNTRITVSLMFLIIW